MAGTPRREFILLVAVVLVVDAVFVAAYFLGGIRGASGTAKLVFTVVWTLATLAIVIAGLTRIRGARGRERF